ncbi:MAG TPA: hypothetical protein VLX31_00995 [Streptosporangiaceae bacterium]|nr:hypothetical protein [Streptosporangiaceae bacterium]
MRTLRLVMVAGSAGAGLCLVLAMIALVVAFGGAKVSPTASTKRTKDTSASLNRTSQRPSPRAWPKVPGSTIADYRGAGSSRRDIFHIDQPGVWGLSWRFSCRVGQGRFMAREIDPDGRQAIEIRSSGAAGQGISWATGDAGRHSLVITSGCSWTAKIVLPRRPARHEIARSRSTP